MFAVHKTEVILPERACAAILATLTFNLIIKISNSGVAYTCACVYFVQGCSEKPKQGFCWNWESELGGGRGKRKKKKKLSGAMHLFKSISICVHIFITSVIIKSGNHRWCPHTVSAPGSHRANEAGLPARPVSTDQVVMWRDRWAGADRWQDDLENLPPFLGSGSSWQVLFHKITSKRNRQGLRINLRLQPAM